MSWAFSRGTWTSVQQQNHSQSSTMATATTVAASMDDNSVLCEKLTTAETKKSMPLSTPIMTPIDSKNSEIDKARNAMRRASLSAAAPPALPAASSSGHNHVVSEDEEDYRMKYIPAHSSRRASMPGPTVENRRQQGKEQEINPRPVHLYQEDDARSNHSRSSRKARRPSVKGITSNVVLLSVAGFTDDGDGYGTDNESVVSARSLQRRASLQQRRASLGMIEPPRTPASSSSGSSAGGGVSELLAAVSKPYLHQDRDDEEEEEVIVQQQQHHHQPLYVPSSAARGVHRSGSNDSREMMDMVKRLEPPQRVSRFARPKDAEPEQPQRGVQRHGTTDSLERNAEPPRRVSDDYSPLQIPSPESPQNQPETPQRGVQRFSTSDSVGMNMRQGLAGAPPHMGAPAVPPHAQSRRGGRRTDAMMGDSPPHLPQHHQSSSEEIEVEEEMQIELEIEHAPTHSHAPPQRGVPRFATNDSVTMQTMQVDGTGRNPRRGKRGEVQIMYAPASSGDDDSDSSLSDPESEPESENDESESEYRGEQPDIQQQAIPQRGVARYATNDSVSMKDMQAAGGRSPRRGKKPSALPHQNANSDDNVVYDKAHAPPPQRGVARFSTGDSVTMQSMRHDSTAKSPRRGGKRASVQGLSQLCIDADDDNEDDGEEQTQQSHAPPPQRGMPRFSTNDSVTMQSMQVDSSQLKSPRRGKRSAVQIPQQQAPPPPQRGVSRFSTGDSVTMQSMRHTSNDSSARSPRRGGKRETVQSLEQLTQSPSESLEQQQLPPTERGVARFSTGDSVTMQSMCHDPSARGGKRETVQGLDQLTQSPQQAPPSEQGVARFSTGDSVTMQSMRHDSSAGSPRRGGKRQPVQVFDDESPHSSPQQAPPPERGVARFSTGDSVTMQSMRHDSSAHSNRRGGKCEALQGQLDQPPHSSPQQQPPPQRGVARFSTGDSVTMQSMRHDSSAHSNRRGGKRKALQGQLDQSPHSSPQQQPPPQRGVALFSTGDSVTMQPMHHNSSAHSNRRGGKREALQGQLDQPPHSSPQQQPPPQRGVARFLTGDSVTMQSMRDDSSAHSNRRGGKREALQGQLDQSPHSSPQQQPPPQRGVARFSTGDSVTMQPMRHDASAHSNHRGGKHEALQGQLDQSPHSSPQQVLPPQRGVARFSTGDSVTMQSMRHDPSASSAVQVAFPMGADDDDDSQSSLSDPGSPQQPEPPQRGVARYSTNDSVTMQSMQVDSGSGRSPRRGKRPTVQGLHGSEANNDDEDDQHETVAPPQRDVARFSTNDSVATQAMELDTSGEDPRRDKRPVQQEGSNNEVDTFISTGDEEVGEEDYDVEIEYVYVEDDEEDLEHGDNYDDRNGKGEQTEQVVKVDDGLETKDGLEQQTTVNVEAQDEAAEAVDVGGALEDVDDEPDRGVFCSNAADIMDLHVAQQNGSAHAHHGRRRQQEMVKENGPKPPQQIVYFDGLPEDDSSFAVATVAAATVAAATVAAATDDNDPEHGVLRTMTADSMDLHMAQQNGIVQARRGRRWEQQAEEDDESRGQVHYVDYGYDGEGFDTS
eukprot:scaffold5367_cov177-Amphora_coffeaeformis.AAC.2